jgi:hypothetical protein
MLYTLAIILLIAWLLGIVGTYTIGEPLSRLKLRAATRKSSLGGLPTSSAHLPPAATMIC